jgi:hypothetical protein
MAELVGSVAIEGTTTTCGSATTDALETGSPGDAGAIAGRQASREQPQATTMKIFQPSHNLHNLDLITVFSEVWGARAILLF